MTRRPLLARLVDATRQIVAVAARAALEWTQADAWGTPSEPTVGSPGRAGGPPAHWVELVRDRAPQLLDTDHDLGHGPQAGGAATDKMHDEAGWPAADHQPPPTDETHATPPVAWRRAPRPRSERSGTGDRAPAQSGPGSAGRGGHRRRRGAGIADELRWRWKSGTWRRSGRLQDEPLSHRPRPERTTAETKRDTTGHLPGESSLDPRRASARADLRKRHDGDQGVATVGSAGEAGPSATEQQASFSDTSREPSPPGRGGRPMRSPVRPVEPPASRRSRTSGRLPDADDHSPDGRTVTAGGNRSRYRTGSVESAEPTPARAAPRRGRASSLSAMVGDDQADGPTRMRTGHHQSEQPSPRGDLGRRSASLWIDLLDPVEPLSVSESPQRERWRTEMDEL